MDGTTIFVIILLLVCTLVVLSTYYNDNDEPIEKIECYSKLFYCEEIFNFQQPRHCKTQCDACKNRSNTPKKT